MSKITDQELICTLSLLETEGVGSVRAKQLIERFGGAENVFLEKKSTLQKLDGIGSITASFISNRKRSSKAEYELDFIRNNKIHVHHVLDDNYPTRLKRCIDAPPILFSKGNVNTNPTKIISIVGTRKATRYGKEITDQIVSDLQKTGVTVISGMAYGIDIQAHKKCVELNLPTIGVLAHGLDMLYPAAHKKTANEMFERGGLITEYMSETYPDKTNFPERNRIVAGMADATVIVESKIRGGALITARIANSYNRDVFAVPGKTTDILSEGCNHLIKTNQAHLIQSTEDLLYIMGWKTSRKKKGSSQRKLAIALEKEEEKVYQLLTKAEKMSLDEICGKLNLPNSEVSTQLLMLEMKDVVKSLPGNQFSIA